MRVWCGLKEALRVFGLMDACSDARRDEYSEFLHRGFAGIGGVVRTGSKGGRLTGEMWT